MSKDIYRFICCLLGASSWLAVQGQSEWRNLGPENLTSNIRSIVYFNEGENLLAGTQGGGLWRSINQGESWEPVVSYEEQAMTVGGSPHISDIAVDGNTIYVATGTGRFNIPLVLQNDPSQDYRTRRSGYVGNLGGKPGAGVMVSLDNGETWLSDRNATNSKPNFAADTFGAPYHAISPFSDIMTIAAKDGLILIGTARGLYYSTDQLATVDTLAGPSFLNQNLIFDIEFAGTAGNEKIYVSAHEDASNSRDRVFVADFQGATPPTFSQLEDAELYGTGGFLNAVSTTRLELAVAPSNPNIVYLAAANQSGLLGVFRTDLTAPGQWLRTATRGTNAFAPLGSSSRDAFVLRVFPDNENELILAGQRWYTFTEEQGWVQTATHGFRGGINYLPTPIYEVTFNPNNPSEFFVGTGESMRASFDRGETFALRSKGLESGLAFSVASFGTTFEALSELDNASADVVLAGLNKEVIYNVNYNTDQPSKQGFGIISFQDYSRVEASAIHPGSLLGQGADGGLVRSTNRGEVFEAFYNLPLVPGVKGLTTVDTFVSATVAFEETSESDTTTFTEDTVLVLLNRRIEIVNDTLSLVGSDSLTLGEDSVFFIPTDTLVSPNNDTTFADTSIRVSPGQIQILVDRAIKARNVTVQESILAGLRPGLPQSAWILDEVVPDAVLDSMQADPDAPNYREYTTQELRAIVPSYVFYCSSRSLWLANGAFGEILQTKWNRITNLLIDGTDEFFTAITVSGDTSHTVYVGTSKGNIWRIERAHDLANFNATDDVFHLTRSLDSAGLTRMRDRWITDLAIDPKNPDRLMVSFAGYGAFGQVEVPSGIYMTDGARLSTPFFAPLAIQPGQFYPNGRLRISQAYSVAFIEAEGEANSVALIGTERELFEVRDIPELAVIGNPGYFVQPDQVSLEITSGNVPIYDIKQRRFVSRITESALVRNQVINLPGGGTEIREVEFDRFVLENDNTVFAATYGRGIWASNGFQARRGDQGSNHEGGLTGDFESEKLRLGPNPAGPQQLPTLRVSLSGTARVALTVYDLNGRRVASQSASFEPGEQALSIEAFRTLDGGLYFVQAEVNDGGETHLRTFKVMWRE